MRKNPKYKNVKAKDLADFIFRNGYLRDYYQAAIKGHSVNWGEIENKFENQLSKDFVHRNVLNVRSFGSQQFKENQQRRSERIYPL